MARKVLGSEPARVKFTNLDKILYPSLGATKYQVIEYYIKIAPRMLGFLADRALTLYRFPDGVDKSGFYEKDAPKGKPVWVKTFREFSETARRDIEYVVCNDLDTLTWLANLAALEINIPLSTVGAHESPDLVLFDIDPEPPASFADAVEVALLLKEKLDLLGLNSYVKTSGKKGLHVVLPIVQKYTFRQTRAFVHQMGKFLAKDSSNIVSEFRQSRDPGTVFVDYLQNTRFKTMTCPYSLRALGQAAVSTPLDWCEVKPELNPEDLNIFSVLERKDAPWKGLFGNKQTLDFETTATAKKRTPIYATTAESTAPSKASPQEPAALEEYARRRDFAKTSEPVGLRQDIGNVFVVQEHQARRLHYDFRLAREGVLKSWAVPKGVPTTHGIKRLAVRTEDHPLEYSEFEGTIPNGQYGAGTVKIWDKGLYELKAWTDDKIEFFLKGKTLNGMYVLVKLKKSSSKPSKQKEWLIIKMRG